jgi:hypothetical protein
MSLQQQINEDNVHERESATERLQSRWISSSRVIADKPPSQPLSPRRVSRRPSICSSISSASISSAEESQWINSKWTSGSGGVITDSPPSQPRSHGRLEQSGSRWNSGSHSQADFGTASSQAPGCHRTIFQPSTISALEHSAPMKKQDSFESTFCTLNLSQRHLSRTASGAESGLRCTTSRSA